MDEPHTHRLLGCSDCDGSGSYDGSACSYCDSRGYYEICAVCREPMGNLRRKWKRAGRPRPWSAWVWRRG